VKLVGHIVNAKKPQEWKENTRAKRKQTSDQHNFNILNRPNIALNGLSQNRLGQNFYKRV